MDTKDILTVEFRENGGLDIQFSEGFLSSSQKDQVLALQDFYREKSLEANSIQELSYDLAKSEQILMVVEALLGKVKRGGRNISRGLNVSDDKRSYYLTVRADIIAAIKR